jgi:transcriptional regulator with XRE-family HTH domain
MRARKPRIRQAEIVRLFAARLRELRMSRGFTQADLARRASITAAYVWRLESAGASPGIDLLARLATALGVTPAELLPTSAAPDTVELLRSQAQSLFNSLLTTADRETLLLVNPLLARLLESPTRRR